MYNSSRPGVPSCPLRKWLWPLAGLAFNKPRHLKCPELITKTRVILSSIRPVSYLRTKPLHVKVCAVVITAIIFNVPCGMWREHLVPFSLGWFFALHATIPFIATIRKAVVMPRYTVIFTIAAAILGQILGARYERHHMIFERTRCMQPVL